MPADKTGRLRSICWIGSNEGRRTFARTAKLFHKPDIVCVAASRKSLIALTGCDHPVTLTEVPLQTAHLLMHGLHQQHAIVRAMPALSSNFLFDHILWNDCTCQSRSALFRAAINNPPRRQGRRENTMDRVICLAYLAPWRQFFDFVRTDIAKAFPA
jgi:hypothetical protein